jgi:hypothetical protein
MSPTGSASLEHLLRGALLAGPLVLAAACSNEPPTNPEPRPAPAVAPAALAAATAIPAERQGGKGGARMQAEPVIGVRFPLPAAMRFEAEHFDPSLPTSKFRHSIRIATDEGPVVLIEVWDNPERQALRPWFDEILGFLVDASTRVSERPMSSAHVQGILLEQPRSAQANSQAIAVFASGTRVFRVTCIDPEGDAAARQAFEHIVDQIDLGGAR